MSPRQLLGLIVLLVVPQSGCSPGPAPAGPEDTVRNQGVLIALPDEKGFASVRNDPPPGPGQAATRLVVDFLSPDQRASSPASVSNVGIRLIAERGRAVTVPLTPSPDAVDPMGKNRFASKAGPYRLGGARGSLSATVDGRSFTFGFEGGR